MHVELMRAHTPSEVGREATCEICAQQFRTEVVLAMASSEEGTFLGYGSVCPACVEALGAYRPDKFPTLEEFEAAKQRFPEPIWESVDAADAAWNQGAPHRAALAGSRIERAACPEPQE